MERDGHDDKHDDWVRWIWSGKQSHGFVASPLEGTKCDNIQ